jgi:hypothetical protein
VFPLVEQPGSVFVPRATVFVLDADRNVVAGPLVITRRRGYHREWLIGLQGLTSRAAVEGWRDHLVAVAAPDETPNADG